MTDTNIKENFSEDLHSIENLSVSTRFVKRGLSTNAQTERSPRLDGTALWAKKLAAYTESKAAAAAKAELRRKAKIVKERDVRNAKRKAATKRKKKAYHRQYDKARQQARYAAKRLAKRQAKEAKAAARAQIKAEEATSKEASRRKYMTQEQGWTFGFENMLTLKNLETYSRAFVLGYLKARSDKARMTAQFEGTVFSNTYFTEEEIQ